MNVKLHYLAYCRNYLNLTEIFVWGQFKMEPNKTKYFSLEQRYVFTFWWLRRANYVTFTEEWLVCTEKIFVKNIYKWATLFQ